MSDLSDLRNQLLKDPEVSREYERLGPLYQVISDVIRLRVSRGLTQGQVAQKIGKQQPAIARLESARVSPSLSFLQDVADALDATLIIRLEPNGPVKSAAPKRVKVRATAKLNT